MTERVEKTLSFLKERLSNSEFFREEPSEGAYRLEHSVRVARIAAEIARREGLDEELLTIAGLLHDVAYGENFPEGYDWKNHGRDSARIARPFLEKLGLSAAEVNDICYAIAIHVDDKADFEWQRTAFSETVGDADNIDRFDTYRIYDTLRFKQFEELSTEERIDWLKKRTEQLERAGEVRLGTPTANLMWREKIDFQKAFFGRLLHQMELGRME